MERLATGLSLAALVVLGLGMYISFAQTGASLSTALIALVVGFIMTQIGMYMGNKFGRSPAPR